METKTNVQTLPTMKKQTAKELLPVPALPLLPAIPVMILNPDAITDHWLILFFLGLFMAGFLFVFFIGFVMPLFPGKKKGAKLIPFPDDYLDTLLKEQKNLDKKQPKKRKGKSKQPTACLLQEALDA